YIIYKVKYSSARALVNTLRTALQAVTVVAGPEPYHIPYTQIQLSTATNLSGSGLSGGGNATGTGGGGGGGLGGGGGGQGGGGGWGGSGWLSRWDRRRRLVVGRLVGKGLLDLVVNVVESLGRLEVGQLLVEPSADAGPGDTHRD